MAQKYLRGVFDLAEALVFHLKHTNLKGGPKAVFNTTQYAVDIVVVALKGEHHIHDVFQNLRARNGSIFGDVADNQHRDVPLLGHLQQSCCALPDLGHATC